MQFYPQITQISLIKNKDMTRLNFKLLTEKEAAN